MGYELSAEHSRAAVKDHTARLATSARAAGPDAPVPTAPGWTVAALVEHLGQTQHWVSELLERRVTDPAQLPTEMDAMPADSGSWSDWLGESARRAGAAASDAALSESADALRGRGETLLWRTTDESSLDASTAWYIERQPDGVQWQHRDDTADVTVSGPARSLLLILTRRVGPTYGQGGSVTIDGDVDLVRHWIQHTAHDAG